MSQTKEGTEMRFLPEVEEALRRAGWFAGRQVEEEILQKWYAFKWEHIPGYCRIFPAAYRFLREFGGLKLDDCVIDPLEALDMWEDMVIYEEWQLETLFYPLGTSESGGVIHIDLQGRLWSFLNHVLLGHNTEEALANILIPGWYWSHPVKGIERNPVDQATEELIKRIEEAERKAVSSL